LLDKNPGSAGGFVFVPGKAASMLGSVSSASGSFPGGFSAARLFNGHRALYRGRMNPNPFRWSFRAQCLLGFLACAMLLGFAVYMERFGGLRPCPLCTFQRAAFIVLGLVFLIGGLHAPRGAAGRRAYGVLGLLAAGVGIAIAGRHVWLTYLPPDQVPACGPDLAYMMDAFPLGDVVRKVLTGSGECAKVDWTLLGMSMPEWSLSWFIVLALWALYAAFKQR
jgi:disulfide bond formation protein DsbB